MKRILQMLCLSVTLASSVCHADRLAALDQHLKVTNADKRQLFLEGLEHEQIRFKLNADGSISYAARQSRKVHSILRQVLGLRKTDDPQGVSLKAELSPQVARALANERIPFELVYSEDGKTAVFKWLSYPYDSAQRVVRDIMRRHEHGS